MDGKSYNLFFDILKTLEKTAREGTNSRTVEDVVLRIMDRYDGSLSMEQKNEVLKEFIKFEKITRNREHSRRFREVIEDES